MTAPSPPDPYFEERIRDSFRRQAFMSTLGATLRSVTPGAVVVELANEPRLTQQHGYTHAGVVASIADSACGYAAGTLTPADHEVLSVEFKLNLLAPAVGDRLEALAQVIRAGRTLSVCRADVFALSGEDERHVAAMQATIIARPIR